MQDFVHVGSDIGQLLWIVLLNGRERWNVDGNGNRSILISQGGVEGGLSLYLYNISMYINTTERGILRPISDILADTYIYAQAYEHACANRSFH